MKYLLVLLFMISTTEFCGASPRIINNKKEAKLVLGKSVRVAIARMDRTFRPLRTQNFPLEVNQIFENTKNNLPMALVSDLNGDKKQDLVVLGTAETGDKPKVKLIVVVSKAKGYVATEADFWQSNRFLKWKKMRRGRKDIVDWQIYLRPLNQNEARSLSSGGFKVPAASSGFKVLNRFGFAKPYFYQKGRVYSTDDMIKKK